MKLDLAEQYIITRLTDELPPELTYHNAAHTRDVFGAAKRLGSLEKVNEQQLNQLLTAALFHDAGFLVSANDHERHSCTIAQHVLPGLGYNATDISQICRLIMATTIPQHPTQLLEEIICDADLDYLGRDDFFIRSELLYQEMRYLGTVTSRDDYNEVQRNFLQEHHYFTGSAQKLRLAKKKENYQKLNA